MLITMDDRDVTVTFNACNIYKNTATQVRARLAPYIHRPDGMSVQLTCAFDSPSTRLGSFGRPAESAPLALSPYIHRPDGLSVQLTCAFDSRPLLASVGRLSVGRWCAARLVP